MNREPGSETEEEEEDHRFDGGLSVPGSIWSNLYRYQKTGVKWLWELHMQNVGGILGDEMGLGKTIEIIAFLSALKHSKLRRDDFVGLGPTIVVCPTTVMHQWVKEFHVWWPPHRVAILHQTGSYSGGVRSALIRSVVQSNGVLITSYQGLVSNHDTLLRHSWHYIILDEGHKIRNPDAQATISCKQFRTQHRIIMSGSPIQNNLRELWSLFDFVFPGKLGTLPTFQQEVAIPITIGGYANATLVQVQTAYKCALVLRNTINPYLLRRMKVDVQEKLELPDKNEQVLFCRLTDEQLITYKEYLKGDEVHRIMSGKYQVFVGLIMLRKICNHPDIAAGTVQAFEHMAEGRKDAAEYMQFGYWRRSGKMIVVESLLKLWKRQGHKVLLFTQSKQMLNILESFVNGYGYSYMSMDGSTNIGSRQPLINTFNEDPNIFIFILTTRVGGLGVNLIGANRVVIFDPDWNPSTDTQARERAWRIGQTRQVTIYRLLTAGTIEEKIYHRQIFKQFLTNRILKDPKQERFFKTNELFDLFTLKETDGGTDTAAIFQNAKVTLTTREKPSPANKKSSPAIQEIVTPPKHEEGKEEFSKMCLSEDRKEYLRLMAQKLSQRISNGEFVARKESAESAKQETKLQSNDSGSPITPKRVKRKNKKKDRKKRRKNIKVDGEEITNLVRLKHAMNKHEDGEAIQKDHKKQDDYVLQQLFKKTSVHSAFEHDNIMNSERKDYKLVEAEADRIARQAAKALKESRRRCQDMTLGVPTWTGQSGLSGAPECIVRKARFGKKKNSLLINPLKTAEKDEGEKPKMYDGKTGSSDTALSSAQLLDKIKERNKLDTPDTLIELTQEQKDLIDDIRMFIAFGGAVDGRSSTDEILGQFRERLPPENSALFKCMLKEICTFTKECGVGIWSLRPEFR